VCSSDLGRRPRWRRERRRGHAFLRLSPPPPANSRSRGRCPRKPRQKSAGSPPSSPTLQRSPSGVSCASGTPCTSPRSPASTGRPAGRQPGETRTPPRRRRVRIPRLHARPRRRRTDLPHRGRREPRACPWPGLHCRRAQRDRRRDGGLLRGRPRPLAVGAHREDCAGRAVLGRRKPRRRRSEEHTSELQSRENLVFRLLLDPPPPQSYTLSLHDALPIFLTEAVVNLAHARGLAYTAAALSVIAGGMAVSYGVDRAPWPWARTARTVLDVLFLAAGSLGV